MNNLLYSSLSLSSLFLSLSLLKDIFEIYSTGGAEWGLELINCQLMFNEVQLCSINTGLGTVSHDTPPPSFSPPLNLSPSPSAVDSSPQSHWNEADWRQRYLINGCSIKKEKKGLGFFGDRFVQRCVWMRACQNKAGTSGLLW